MKFVQHWHSPPNFDGIQPPCWLCTSCGSKYRSLTMYVDPTRRASMSAMVAGLKTIFSGSIPSAALALLRTSWTSPAYGPSGESFVDRWSGSTKLTLHAADSVLNATVVLRALPRSSLAVLHCSRSRYGREHGTAEQRRLHWAWSSSRGVQGKAPGWTCRGRQVRVPRHELGDRSLAGMQLSAQCLH